MSEAGGSKFETALTELEEILRRLDSDELRLDEALDLFERGIGQLRTANRLLDEARGTVEEVISRASGELRTVDVESVAEPRSDADDV